MTPKPSTPYTPEQIRCEIESYEFEDAIVWAAQRYLEALPIAEYYGDERHWQFQYVPQANIVWEDKGQRARDFLKGGEK